MKKFINFKDQSEVSEIQYISPKLLIILADASKWANDRGLEFTITRLIDGMIDGVSKTDIHSTGRAADVRSITWKQSYKNQLVEYINNKYSEEWGAGPLSLCVMLHDGTAEHFHFQVRI